MWTACVHFWVRNGQFSDPFPQYIYLGRVQGPSVIFLSRAQSPRLSVGLFSQWVHVISLDGSAVCGSPIQLGLLVLRLGFRHIKHFYPTSTWSETSCSPQFVAGIWSLDILILQSSGNRDQRFVVVSSGAMHDGNKASMTHRLINDEDQQEVSSVELGPQFAQYFQCCFPRLSVIRFY